MGEPTYPDTMEVYWNNPQEVYITPDQYQTVTEIVYNQKQIIAQNQQIIDYLDWLYKFSKSVGDNSAFLTAVVCVGVVLIAVLVGYKVVRG